MSVSRSFFFLFLSGMLFSACQSDQRDLRPYYYPYEELKDGMVYEYRAVDRDSVFPDYWYLRTLENEEQEQVLVSQLYGPAFDIELISTEILVEHGSIMRDYRLYETNDQGKSLTISTRIEDNNIFPFYVDEETGFLRFKMIWNEIREPDMQTTLTRGRQFQEIVEQDYQGKSISVAKFGSTELVEFDHPEEGHREYEVHTFETFAKGIGLIHYRKQIVDGPTIEYELVDRFPMTELEKRYLQQ